MRRLGFVLSPSMRLMASVCASLALASCALLSPGQAATAHASESAAGSRSGVRYEMLSIWNTLRGDAYALDGVDRWLEPGRRAACDQKGLVTYKGTSLRYAGAVTIAPAFEQRLARFEAVAAEVAREVYGREPRLIRHYGAFSCRSTRNRKHVLSEHALGNALDLVGFDFGAATKAQPLPDGLPKQLRWGFQVRVARHWSPTAASGEAGAVHARFLATLTQRLRERNDIFRCMFGPGHGGHDDHLHLDAAPWRYVDL